MHPILATTHLYYANGSSDKEYHAEIVEVAAGHVVNFRHGRRGATLIAGTKTAIPVAFPQAQKIYDQLVKSKLAKGYTPDSAGTPYQGTADTGRQTDFIPQLLNPITEDQAMRLIEDDQWGAQEKMDGERRAVHVADGCVTGINRKGLSVPLPQAIADELLERSVGNGALRVDGELIGDTLWVFDLHRNGRSLQSFPWLGRMQLAETALAGCQTIRTVPVAVTADEKRRLWEQVKAGRGEGIVFKLLSGPVREGRPSSGGEWLKFKFTETASCRVMAVNAGKRSVRIGLLGSDHPDAFTEHKVIPVGNVTIPPNYDVPATGDIVEVEYLYAYPGGSLYQPVYRGKRSDLDSSACVPGQLKYKPAGCEDGDA